MSDYGRLAKSSRWGVAVAAYEVFFLSEKSARQCEEKYGGELQKLDDGWLVRKKIQTPSNDDPITQAIWKSLEDAGLISS